MVGETGVASVKLTAQYPKDTAVIFERLILFGEGSVRRAAAKFIVHYDRRHRAGAKANNSYTSVAAVKPEPVSGSLFGELSLAFPVTVHMYSVRQSIVIYCQETIRDPTFRSFNSFGRSFKFTSGRKYSVTILAS